MISAKNPMQQGYIALMSSIVISALLLAVTVSLGFSGFLGRLNILDLQSKEQSSVLAQTCVDVARLNLAKDTLYSPSNQLITVGADQCTIISVENSGNQKTIKTQASVNHAFTNLEVFINSNTFAVVSLQELPNF